MTNQVCQVIAAGKFQLELGPPGRMDHQGRIYLYLVEEHCTDVLQIKNGPYCCRWHNVSCIHFLVSIVQYADNKSHD